MDLTSGEIAAQAPSETEITTPDIEMSEDQLRAKAIAVAKGQVEEPKAEPKIEEQGLPPDRLAILAKMQKKTKEREDRARLLEKQLEEKQKKLEDAVLFFEEFKNDPLSAIRKQNLDLNDLYARGITETQESEDPLFKKINELESKLTSKEKHEAEAAEKRIQQEQTAHEERKTRYIKHLDEVVKQKSDQYPMLQLGEDQGELIFKVQDNYHKETGKVLSLDESLDLINDYMENKFKEIVTSNDKVRNKLLTFLGHEQPETLTPEIKSQNSFTIDDSLPRSTAPQDSLEKMSEYERMELAKKQATELFKNMA